jgi:hypothetical protein
MILIKQLRNAIHNPPWRDTISSITVAKIENFKAAGSKLTLLLFSPTKITAMYFYLVI